MRINNATKKSDYQEITLNSVLYPGEDNLYTLYKSDNMWHAKGGPVIDGVKYAIIASAKTLKKLYSLINAYNQNQ